MDHDSHELRISRIEQFLDANARGWRDQDNWRPTSVSDAKASDLVVDEEQTRKDRIALGLEADPDAADPDDVVEQGERADLLAKLEPHRGQEGFPELTGEETNDELRAMLDKANARGGSAAGAVALEGANANPAAEQALQTAQSPERQDRAEAQQEQKRAVEETGGRPARTVRPG